MMFKKLLRMFKKKERAYPMPYSRALIMWDEYSREHKLPLGKEIHVFNGNDKETYPFFGEDFVEILRSEKIPVFDMTIDEPVPGASPINIINPAIVPTRTIFEGN